MQEPHALDINKSCQSSHSNRDSQNKLPSHEPEQLFPSHEDIVSGKISASYEGCQQEDSSYVEMTLQPIQVRSGEDRGLHELSMRSHQVDLAGPLSVSSVSDVSSMNLMHLAEIVKGLNEEEYRFLLMSRESVSDVDHEFSETFQRFKEQLFLANLMMNIFSLQLAELVELQMESDNQRYQLIDEQSQLQVSHKQLNEKNQHLAEELANCRVELHGVSLKNVELQNQFNTAKAEVEALCARVLEMRNSFEISRKDSLDLSKELANCRALVSSLQSENKDLNETIAFVIEEKNKLVEGKEFHLCESKKLTTELADFKSSMEGVKAENYNLSECLSMATEERNKINAENERLYHEFDRLSKHLVASKDLVASLQAENSNLNGSLALSADKIEKLEEDKQIVHVENQSLSSQIVALQDQLSVKKGEQMRYEAELKEVTMSLEQLTKENVFLSSTLDVHKAKIEEISVHLLLSKDGDLGNQTQGALEQNKALEVAVTEGSQHMAHNEKCDDLLGRNEVAVGVVHQMYSDLRNLVLSHCGSMDEDKLDVQSEALPNLLRYESYQTILKYLGDLLDEKLEHESVTKEIKSDLTHRETELDELNMKCQGLDSVSKFIEDVEGVLNVDDMKNRINKAPVSCLEMLVSSLVQLQKIREAEIQLRIAKQCSDSKEMEYSDLQEKMHCLDTLCLEHENEILILKESLCQAGEALAAARFELHKKSNELEQSELRVTSIREKLSIAVTKGKALVMQRDGLKQTLVETSSELERCLQELQLKDARLHEVETKLRTSAEACEHVEALESELSYIRNSANTLRESFILKDSVLQRIEEIVENLDLPKQFRLRDTIEKIDWLARSVSGKLSMNDSDHKMDSWKDDGQLQADSGDDFFKKFEDLQSKYYGLAEQNEMLEQSLMERNALVQRWEQLVDMIDTPSHLHSMEMEDRIEWVGRALVEARHHIDSLQLKIEKYDSYCGLLNADLEEYKRRVSALNADLGAVNSERDHLSERVETLRSEWDKLSVRTRQAELENEKLHDEINTLKEKLKQKASNEEQIFTADCKIRKLRDLVGDALEVSETDNLVSGSGSIDSLEELLRKLIENHAPLSSQQPACGNTLDGLHTEQDNVITLHEARSIEMHHKEEHINYKKDLEDALHELMHLKGERDRSLEKHTSLSSEAESLSKRIAEFQELLNHEKQKSASVREKLNVAVRKGKSLVQQRDSLKQTVEEMSIEMEHLKSEISDREHTLAGNAQKFKELLTFPDRLEALESENLLLKNHLAETEHHLEEREYTLKVILDKLGEIEVGDEGNSSDPVKKLECIGNVCSDLHVAVASLEHESRKSKRASELLLAELNEVQERNDTFQEELAKVAAELVILRKERDSAEAAKLEAVSYLEKLSALHVDRKKNQFSEIMGLKFSMNQLCKGFCEVEKLLASAFFNDLESFQNLAAGIESCMKCNNAANVVDSFITEGHGDFLCSSSDSKKSSVFGDSWSNFDTIDHFDDNTEVEICRIVRHQLQELLVGVGSIKESICLHSNLAQEQGKALSKLMVGVQREMASKRESCETMRKEISVKDGELVALRGNIAYLYEACITSVIVIENGKAEVVGKRVASSDLGINLKAAASDDGLLPFGGQVELMSEDSIKTVADRLLLAGKELASIKTEFLDANQKEMKATITKLQRELQEKDVQRERICMEFVNQIKDAEAAANSHSLDLQSSRIQEQNLKKQVEDIEAERKILEQRVNELVDRQGTAAELGMKIKSQTDMLAAKDQEIESLMHALDEEEMQMEELTWKIDELEKVVQKKNQEIESLEDSHGKVLKKLTITVSKFDELHHLSSSLLAEVEKLQFQLQERDTDISFLRQEVTRCTNDVLVASQMSDKRCSDEIFEFLMWFDMIVSRDKLHDMHPAVKRNSQVNEYKEILLKKIMSVLSELDNLRADAESKDAILQVEKSKVDELTRKAETLEMSLHEKESQLNLLEEMEETGRGAGASSEILEVDSLMNKWTAAGNPVTPQIRSLRKGNNDHIAIAVDVDEDTSSRIEDEEDDKV